MADGGGRFSTYADQSGDSQESTRQAVMQNARFLCKMYADVGLELGDALILLTYIGELSLPLVGKWGEMVVHVCSSFPKAEVVEALANYRGGKNNQKCNSKL